MTTPTGRQESQPAIQNLPLHTPEAKRIKDAFMGISNDIGARIDMLYELREQRLGIEKRVKELKEQEVQARNDIFELLASMGLTKASGALATCGIKVTNVPLVEDWDTLWGYIQQTGEFDLVQKRISVTAWRARFDDGVTIPGVSKVEDVDISLTKASRSI